MDYQTASPVTLSKKLSSAKTIYDGVFSTPSSTQPRRNISARVDDYREIFRGSKDSSSGSSSIPYLDAPELNERKVSVDVKSSKVDYDKIFGGFGDFDGALSYEDVVFKPKKKKGSGGSKEPRIPVTMASPLKGSDLSDCPVESQVKSHKESYQSFVGTKQFNMPYRKTSPEISNVANATHIAELHAVPGYSYIVDEGSLKPMTKDDKPVSTNAKDAVYNVSRKDMSGHLHGVASKQTSDDIVKPQNKCCQNRATSNDVLFDDSEINLSKDPRKKDSAPSNLRPDLGNVKEDIKRPMTSKNKMSKSNGYEKNTGIFSPSNLDEEMDANSSAAASVAALKVAIEKAQARILIAKESKDKKFGFQNSAKPGFKEGFRPEKRKECKSTSEENESRENNPQEICGNIDAAMWVFPGIGKQKVIKAGQAAPDTSAGQKVSNSRVATRETQVQSIRSTPLDHRSCRADVEEGEKVCELGSSAFKQAENAKKTTQSTDECICKEVDMNEKKFEKPVKSGEIYEVVDEKSVREQKATEKTDEHHGHANEYSDLNPSKEFIDKEEKKITMGVATEQEEMVKKPPETSCEKKICGEEMEMFNEPIRIEKKTEHQEMKEVEIEKQTEHQEMKEVSHINVIEGSGQLETEKEEEASEQGESNHHFNSAGKMEETEMTTKETCSVEEQGRSTDGTSQMLPEATLASRDKANEKDQADSKWISDSVQKMDVVHMKGKIGQLLAREHIERIRPTLNEEWEAKNGNILKQLSQLKEYVKTQVENWRWVETDRKQAEVDLRAGGYKFEATQEACLYQRNDYEEDHNASGQDHGEHSSEIQQACMLVENSKHVEAIPKFLAEEQNATVLKLTEALVEPRVNKNESEAAEEIKEHEEEVLAEEQNGTFMEVTEAPVEPGVNKNGSEAMEEIKEPEVEVLAEEQNGPVMKVTETPVEPRLHKNESEVVEDIKEPEEEVLAEKQSETVKEVTEASVEPRGDKDESEAVEQIREPKEQVLAPECIGTIMEVTKASVESTVGKNEPEAVEDIKQEEEQKLEGAGSVHSDTEFTKLKEQTGDTAKVESVQTQQEQYMKNSEASDLGFMPNRSCGLDKDAKVCFNKEEESSSNKQGWVDDDKCMEATQVPCMSNEKFEMTDNYKEVKTGENEVNIKKNHHSPLEEKVDTFRKEMELEKERPSEKNGAREIEREKEKQRIAVERAMREARERAFAEARRKILSETRERSEKATAGTGDRPSADKASIEAKLKAERAAVGRATTEARERALKKALSEKAAKGVRNHANVNEMRRTCSSNDSQYSSSGPSNSKYSDPSTNGAPSSSERLDGVNGESAQRCKARLERHQRTAERAAKALAEKNMRDLLAQKEQQERNRLAEALDADIKRWSIGKEKNLRALLSTLQYILGPDSGWQPIPLTDLVTAAAAKKAYRKATLCVHPDKLQQRGASIQQKYICEKVFDLLKEAWNRFSVEER